MKYLTLEFIPEVEDIDEFAGTFFYCDDTGEECEAKFYVRCPSKDEDDSKVTMRRQDEYNSQMTDMWTKLQEEGCSNIKFKNLQPDPFF